ncbi:hypothetical protein JVU11DRAFT_11758 [Chiua virens]|nr:hypothetical protein JVU11DRAFT_11758 [Chiua virens]
MFHFNITLNSGLCYINEYNVMRSSLPDFQLEIENNYKQMTTSKWIREVCFTTSSSDTHNCLWQIIAQNPTINLIFMITIIEESTNFKSGLLEMDNRITVVLEQFAWISIQHIEFKRLFPEIEMADMDLVFLNASNNLRESFVLEMEGTNTPPNMIKRVHTSPASLVIPWEDVLLSYKTAVLGIAYQHYKKWCTHAM